MSARGAEAPLWFRRAPRINLLPRGAPQFCCAKQGIAKIFVREIGA